MKWTCPHCSKNLELSDTDLAQSQSAWAFARCFSCHAYSMIRPKEFLAEKSMGPKSSPFPDPLPELLTHEAPPSSWVFRGVGLATGLLAFFAGYTFLEGKIPADHPQAVFAHPVSDQIKSAQASATQPPRHATVKVKRAILRSGPGTEFEALSSIQEGTPLSVLSTSGDWLKISHRDSTQSLWIRKDLITTVQD